MAAKRSIFILLCVCVLINLSLIDCGRTGGRRGNTGRGSSSSSSRRGNTGSSGGMFGGLFGSKPAPAPTPVKHAPPPKPAQPPPRPAQPSGHTDTNSKPIGWNVNQGHQEHPVQAQKVSGVNSAPSAPKIDNHAPSAPVLGGQPGNPAPGNIGWNVPNSGGSHGGIPPPVRSPGLNNAPNQGHAPPPYSSIQNQPPAYSAQHPNGPPPAYGSPPGYSHGAPPPAYNAPNYQQGSHYNPQGGHAYPNQGQVGYPQQGYGGYHQPGYGGHPQQGYGGYQQQGYGGYQQQGGYSPFGFGGGGYGNSPFGGGYGGYNNGLGYKKRGFGSYIAPAGIGLLAGVALWELTRSRENYHVYHVHNHYGGGNGTASQLSNDAPVSAGNTYIVTPNNVKCDIQEMVSGNNTVLSMTCNSTEAFNATMILPSNATTVIPCYVTTNQTVSGADGNAQQQTSALCNGTVQLNPTQLTPAPNTTKNDPAFGLPLCNVTVPVNPPNATAPGNATSNENPNSNQTQPIETKVIQVPCIYLNEATEQQKLQAQSSIATLQNLDQKTVKALAESAYLGDIYKIFSL